MRIVYDDDIVIRADRREPSTVRAAEGATARKRSGKVNGRLSRSLERDPVGDDRGPPKGSGAAPALDLSGPKDRGAAGRGSGRHSD
jgi:hypothetical protein